MLPIRFINLDRAGERRRSLEAQAQALGLALERVRAVEVGDIPAERTKALARTWERDLSGGEIGCFLSHVGQWERIVREDRPALILEDDAVLSRRLPGALAAIEGLEGVDLLNLEDLGRRRFLARGGGEALTGDVGRVRCHRDKAGTAGYVVWPSGARRLLHGARDRAAPADAWLHGAALEAYVCEPPLVLQAFVLDALGGQSGLEATSFVQPEAGGPRKPRARTPAQVARRARTQLALLPLQARRLTDIVYRRVACDLADFR